MTEEKIRELVKDWPVMAIFAACVYARPEQVEILRRIIKEKEAAAYGIPVDEFNSDLD